VVSLHELDFVRRLADSGAACLKLTIGRLG
jgi:hypothetical protein